MEYDAQLKYEYGLAQHFTMLMQANKTRKGMCTYVYVCVHTHRSSVFNLGTFIDRTCYALQQVHSLCPPPTTSSRDHV